MLQVQVRGFLVGVAAAALASVVLGGCAGESDSEPSGASAAPLGASPPIQLYFARAGLVDVDTFQLAGTLQGTLDLENLAYEKRVDVHYTLGNGVWADAPAHYVASLGGNRERWAFTLRTPPAPRSRGVWRSFEFQFALRYQAAGRTYWDNGAGAGIDYRAGSLGEGQAHPEVVFGRSLVAAARAEYGSGQFSGTVYTRSSSNQGVAIVFTTDHWRTVREADANVWRTGEALGWSFGVPLQLAPDATIEWAVRDRANGVEVWDNNFGRNYRTDAARPLSQSSPLD